MSSGSEWLVSMDDWAEWSKSYEWLPIILKQSLPDGFKIDTWERAWILGQQNAFVLESGKGGRYTYLGLSPASIIYGKGDQCVVVDHAGEEQQRKLAPLAAVKSWLSVVKAPPVEGAPVFYGGAVGFWGYDIARTIERLPVIASDDFGLPDYCFYQMNELWIIDHEQFALYMALHVHVDDRTELSAAYQKAENRVLQMAELWTQLSEPSELAAKRRNHYETVSVEDRLTIDIDAIAGLKKSFNKTEFAQAVEKIQQYIRQGDVFQVNLSTRQSLKLTKETPEELYEWLRIMNPSPYMGLFKHANFQLVSASPELLVKLYDGQISTKPIAGTRKRGTSDIEDSLLKTELTVNEKERAEHIMLVDLLRNDLGRVCAYGTVKVKDLMTVEAYSHVMHLVSEVTGELAAHYDGFDVLAAVFPGGTITGAPKIRTMEIIEELEPVRRGPYTGSIGWIDYRGNMEFNIVIRTLTVKDGIGHVQAGAGIVIDSDPIKEYEESLNKAKALWKAVEYSRLFSAEEEVR